MPLVQCGYKRDVGPGSRICDQYGLSLSWPPAVQVAGAAKGLCLELEYIRKGLLHSLGTVMTKSSVKPLKHCLCLV